MQFQQDDEGYLNWVKDHPDGFVVNYDPVLSWMMLHHASCYIITTRKKRNWTRRGKAKICSPSKKDLRDYTKGALQLGEAFHYYELCKP